MHLTQNDIDELRLLADKAKMTGRFETGQRLHELLDAHEELEIVEKSAAEKIDEAETDRDEAREEAEEAAEDLERSEKIRKIMSGALDQIQARITDLRLHRRADPSAMDVASLAEEVTELRTELGNVEADVAGAL